MNWKDPGRGAAALGGSFTAVLLSVMEPRSPTASTLSIQNLNEMLDTLHQATKADKRAALGNLFTKCTAKEMLWVVKIILKDLKMGLGQNPLFKFFHKDGLRHFEVR